MAKDLTEALAALTEGASGSTTRKEKSLTPKKSPDEIPSRTAAPSGKTTNGKGIASPLTETAYSERLWHPEKTSVSTDGIWVVRMKPIKQMRFTDANDNVAVFDFKEPV